MKGWQAAPAQNVFSKLIIVTPQMAIKMLHESNGANRPLSRYRVNVLAESIKRGEWVTNSNSIGFDINGDLSDGQHRLHAIIQAQQPIATMVTYNLPPESFKTTDIGKSRSSGDIASIVFKPELEGGYTVQGKDSKWLITAGDTVIECMANVLSIFQDMGEAEVVKELGK